jgi:hypothetical protein
LICDCVFTRQGAAEHADVVCHRVMSVKAVLNSKLVLSIECRYRGNKRAVFEP